MTPNATTERSISTTIAAIVAALITTGMTSAVSHTATLLGGSVASLMLAGCAVLSANARAYLFFLFGTIALMVLALVSAEVNTAEISSTIHVLSCYAALGALAFSSTDVSSFCRQLILGTNLILTYWILYQAYHLSALEAWLISNPSGAGNLMAAQINMTLPLVLSKFDNARGIERLPWLILLPLNCLAVFLVMSRNGIGAMLIVLTLYILFNHKRLAVLFITGIASMYYFLDSILQTPFVHQLLVKMRLVGFVPAAPRSLIWKITWHHTIDHPMLGVGPGKPQKFLAVMDINHAHNNFLQVAFESGFPAALIFTTMMLLLLWLPVRAVFQRREQFVPTIPIVAYIIFSWTGGPLAFPGATLLLAACVNEARCGVFGGEKLGSTRKYTTTPMPRVRLPATATVALASAASPSQQPHRTP
jgi:O-antigen ligase